MKYLNFSTELGTVEIQLFDNPFVSSWIEHTRTMIQNYGYRPRTSNWPYVHHDKTGHGSVIDRVLAIVDEINHQDYLCPLPETVQRQDLSKLNLDTQYALNRLHRYCVNATNYRDRWIPAQPTWQWIPYEHERFDYLINLLNQTIHEFEAYVETPRRRNYLGDIKTTEFILEASRYSDVDVYHHDVDITIPADMQKYLSISGADVWIKKDILGKDFITAFVDHDDPWYPDIQPPPMFSGGFVIDFSGRDRIYRSNEFIGWLGKPVSKYHGNYALGNVVHGKSHARFCSQVIDIEIV